MVVVVIVVVVVIAVEKNEFLAETFIASGKLIHVLMSQPASYTMRRLPDSALLIGRSFQTKLNRLNDELLDLNEKLTGRSRHRRPNEALDELLSIEQRLLQTPLTTQDDEAFARRIDLILGLSPKPPQPNEWELEGQSLLVNTSIYPPAPAPLRDTPDKTHKKPTIASHKLQCSSYLHVSLTPTLTTTTTPTTTLTTTPATTLTTTPATTLTTTTPFTTTLYSTPKQPEPPIDRYVTVVYAGTQFPGKLLHEDGAFVEVLFPDGVQARLLKSQLL